MSPTTAAAPPALGQDTHSLLRQLGYSENETKQLVDAGVVRCQAPPVGDPSGPSANELASA